MDRLGRKPSIAAVILLGLSMVSREAAATTVFSMSTSLVPHGGYVNLTWKVTRTFSKGKSVAQILLVCPTVSSKVAPTVSDATDIFEGPAQGATITVGPLLNMRDVSCTFHYSVGGLVYLDQNAAKGQWTFQFERGQRQAMQEHLSLTSKLTEMRLTWVSALSHSPIVTYRPVGTQGNNKTVQAIFSTYTNNSMCGPEATKTGPNNFINPGYIHTAVMGPLAAATDYEYSFGDAISQTNNWTTFHSPLQSSSSVNVVVFGDMGTWGTSIISDNGKDSPVPKVLKKVQDLISSTRVDLITHVGDLAYADGMGKIWERFFWRIEGVANQVPYHPVIGNHEYGHVSSPSPNDPSNVPGGQSYNPPWGNYGDESSGECAVPVYQRFNMPNSTGSNSVFWYSHHLGNVHFTYISTEHDLSPGSTQYQWLDSDLAAVDSSAQPWKVVVGHRPIYNSQTNWTSETKVGKALQQRLEPLFLKHKVSVYFAGHYHSYQRSCPVAGNKCAGTEMKPHGTVHFTVGTAGAKFSSSPYDETVGWSRKTLLLNYGYLAFQTVSSTTMKLAFTDIDGVQKDSVTLGRFLELEPTTVPIPTTTVPTPATNLPTHATEPTYKTDFPTKGHEGGGGGGGSSAAPIVGGVLGGILLIALMIAIWKRREIRQRCGNSTDGLRGMKFTRQEDEDDKDGLINDEA